MNKMYYYFIVCFGNDFDNFAIFNNYAEAKRFCDIFYNEDSFIIEKKIAYDCIKKDFYYYKEED